VLAVRLLRETTFIHMLLQAAWAVDEQFERLHRLFEFSLDALDVRTDVISQLTGR
jgi:hypothetical protein